VCAAAKTWTLLSSGERADDLGVTGSDTGYLSGGPSEWFAEEVREAMQLGVPLLLANEMPPGPNEARGARAGVEFGTFFACKEGATPTDLLQAGIYKKISVGLKGAPYREVSLALALQALAAMPTREPSKDPAMAAWRKGAFMGELGVDDLVTAKGYGLTSTCPLSCSAQGSTQQ